MARRTTQQVDSGRSHRSAKQQTALVRTFGGLEVRDAKADLRIPVNAEDVAHAERKNPERCVFAMACQRHFGSTAAVFFKSFAYVDIKGEDGERHVERFVVNGTAQKLIAQFDSDGPAGVPTDDRWIVLKAPSAGRTLDYNLEKNRVRRQKRRATLKGECEEFGEGGRDTKVTPRLSQRTTPRELEIRDGTGQWQMIRKNHNGTLGKLSAEDVAAICAAREENLGTLTKEGKPRRFASTELVSSLAEQYGVTSKQIKSIWRDR